MKKFFLAIICGLLLFLFGVSVSYRLVFPYEKSKPIEKYFIYMVDVDEFNTDYSLELDEHGNYNLTVKRRTNSLGEGVKQYNYDLELSKEEYNVVKKVIDYFENTYKIGSRKEYSFYFDYETHHKTVFPDDNALMVKMVEAVENIALGNEISGMVTKKEIGDSMLNSIKDEV